MAREVKMADGSVEILNDHFQKLVDSDARLNDSDGLFFQRQLEVIEQTTYDVLYPDLEARDCFPTLTLGGAGATSFSSVSQDMANQALRDGLITQALGAKFVRSNNTPSGLESALS